MKYTHQIFDLKELSTQELLDNIKIMSDTLALLANALHPGQHATAVNQSLDWINKHRDQYLRAFVLRPEARQLAPEIFEPPKRIDPDAKGAQNIQGSYY
jgi:hypothetical protein